MEIYLIHTYIHTREILQAIPVTAKYFAKLDAVHGYFRWVPPLGPVGTPDPMGISTKGDLYIYIHSATTLLMHLLSSLFH